jgi:hypothetical protein
MMAHSSSPKVLERNSTVVVVGVRDGVAEVAPTLSDAQVALDAAKRAAAARQREG